MLALIYLVFVILLGACICGRFYRFASVVHYLAASFLVGAVLSTWATYLFALLFASSSRPLLGANIVFFTLAGAVIYQLRPRSAFDLPLENSRPPGSAKWDAVLVGAFLVVACYLMFGTIWLREGTVRLAFVVWNDFGPNLSLMQSFAMGHNFPTEYPHFIGQPIRQHFLFWFQAGNLEFLGLNIVWALNLFSVLSLLAMVILILTLGEILFNSRAVGRIAASLFFFPSTLSYIPFLHSQKSPKGAVSAIRNLNHWLTSGYPYRGEDWGTQSLGIFYVQRHLLVAVGILLLVVTFIVARYRNMATKRVPRGPSDTAAKHRTDEPANEQATGDDKGEAADRKIETLEAGETFALAAPGAGEFQVEKAFARGEEDFRAAVPGFVFAGVLIGLLPMWNSAVFVAAAAVLAVLFILFPLKKQMLALGISAGVIALPQIFYLTGKSGQTLAPNLIHWGYTLVNPTIWDVTKYLGFTFGFKWLLIALALLFASGFQRRIFAASLALIFVAFLLQFSVETVANHKFLNIWVILANLFVAFALWRIGRATIAGKVVATILAIAVTLGGVIEWFRIHNDTVVDVRFNRSRLSEWLQTSTRVTDIFLTDKFVLDPILLNGRRIFYGWSYFAWSLGYPAAKRDVLYKQMWTTKALPELVRLLNDNGICYVAFDNGIRSGEFRSELNEELYKNHFEKVFDDKENLHGSLMIYRVPLQYSQAEGP